MPLSFATGPTGFDRIDALKRRLRLELQPDILDYLDLVFTIGENAELSTDEMAELQAISTALLTCRLSLLSIVGSTVTQPAPAHRSST